MELKEIESEVREQEESSADIALEVHNHRQQAERLEAAVHALLEAQMSVDSEGVRRAIDHASEATHATRQRLEELREQKQAMLERNQQLQARCLLAVEKKQQAQEKLPKLLWGETRSIAPGDPGFPLYGTMEELIRDSISHLATALSDLKTVRQRLEALPI